MLLLVLTSRLLLQCARPGGDALGLGEASQRLFCYKKIWRDYVARTDERLSRTASARSVSYHAHDALLHRRLAVRSAVAARRRAQQRRLATVLTSLSFDVDELAYELTSRADVASVLAPACLSDEVDGDERGYGDDEFEADAEGEEEDAEFFHDFDDAERREPSAHWRASRRQLKLLGADIRTLRREVRRIEALGSCCCSFCASCCHSCCSC